MCVWINKASLRQYFYLELSFWSSMTVVSLTSMIPLISTDTRSMLRPSSPHDIMTYLPWKIITQRWRLKSFARLATTFVIFLLCDVKERKMQYTAPQEWGMQRLWRFLSRDVVVLPSYHYFFYVNCFSCAFKLVFNLQFLLWLQPECNIFANVSQNTFRLMRQVSSTNRLSFNFKRKVPEHSLF